MGFEGAPSAQTISLHWPMKNIKTALGVLLFNESIGSRNYKNIYLNYAYRIPIGNGKLSLGLKGGISTGRLKTISCQISDWEHIILIVNFLPVFLSHCFWATKMVERPLACRFIMILKSIVIMLLPATYSR